MSKPSPFATEANLLNEKNSLAALKGKQAKLVREFPTIFHLDVTGKCNLQRLYCQRDFFTKTKHPFLKDNMPQEVFEKLVPHFKGAKVVALLSMLGEPLLVKELPKWWETILEAGAKPQTTTNGTFLTPELADHFTRLGGRLKISIDTVNQAEMDILRPKMTVDLLMNRLDLLNQKRKEHNNSSFQLGVNVCVTAKNIGSIVETMEECMRRVRVDLFTFAAFRLPRNEQGNFHQEAQSLSLDLQSPEVREGWLRILEWAERANKQDGVRFVFPYRKSEWKMLLGSAPGGLTESAFEDTDLSSSDYYCCVPWMKVHVLSNGDVIPCQLLYWPQPELVMGNLLEKSFEEIWLGDKFTEFRQNMVSEKYNFCGECKSWWRIYTPERVD